MLDPKKMKTSELLVLITNPEAAMHAILTDEEIDCAPWDVDAGKAKIAQAVQLVVDEIDQRIPIPGSEAGGLAWQISRLTWMRDTPTLNEQRAMYAEELRKLGVDP